VLVRKRGKSTEFGENVVYAAIQEDDSVKKRIWRIATLLTAIVLMGIIIFYLYFVLN